MGYLFAAAAVVWLGMLVTALAFMGRQARLRREIDDLRRLVQELTEPGGGANGRE